MSLTVRLFRDDRRCLLLVLPLAVLLFSAGLGDRDLWDPDEPRTAEIASEILAGGSWAALHENGALYVEKPPLAFWLAAACTLPAGRVTEFAIRLPSSLAAVVGVAVLFYLGRALFGRRPGALAALVLLTAQDYFMEARWAHPDMLWTLFLTSACLFFYLAYGRDGARGWLAGFYAAVGLAILTKGPAALLIVLLAVLFFLAATGDLRFLRRAGLSWGLPLALLPATLWLVAYASSAGMRFPLGEAFARIGRRVAHGIHHPHPFGHVLTALAVEFLPWTLFLPGALWLTFPRRRGRRDPETAYLYSWILAVFSVFALSAEKRGVYLLPLLPFLAVLIGRLWDTALMRWEPSPVERAVFWPLVTASLLACGFGAFYVARVAREMPALRGPATALAAAALLTSLAALAIRRLRGEGAALGVFTGGLAACYLIIALFVLPAIDRYKSARPFGARIAAAARGAPLAIYPDPHDAYAFYSGRAIKVLPSREALRAFLGSAPDALCLMDEDRFAAERRLLDVPLRAVDRERVGHRSMVLVAASSPGDPVGTPLRGRPDP